MTVPRAWLDRFPEDRLKTWHLSWRETEERVAYELERGPLGTRPAKDVSREETSPREEAAA